MTKFDTCPVCNGKREICFEETVLNKYPVSYGICSSCGLIQTEKPYWLDEAYDEAIAITDTGLVQRNISLATKLAAALYFILDIKGRCIDVAGGYGMLVRMMRDMGFDFYWEDKYCENILSKGFEASELDSDFDAVTAFEVMEHVHDPVGFVSEAMERSGSKTFIFSTQLYDYGTAPGRDWWYYSFETGQHISFYTDKTLSFMAEKLGLNFFSAGGLHFFTDRKIQPIRLWFLRGRIALLLSLYIRWRKGSKVMDDHYLMVGRIKS
jgi:hypothetical protein